MLSCAFPALNSSLTPTLPSPHPHTHPNPILTPTRHSPQPYPHPNPTHPNPILTPTPHTPTLSSPQPCHDPNPTLTPTNPAANLTEPCLHNSDCIADHAHCLNNTCRCMQGYYPSDTQCNLGKPANNTPTISNLLLGQLFESMTVVYIVKSLVEPRN